jgi:DNA-binding CsgD family transcriptional regulator
MFISMVNQKQAKKIKQMVGDGFSTKKIALSLNTDVKKLQKIILNDTFPKQTTTVR